MSVELTIIISLVGRLIGVISFVIGQRKSGKDDRNGNGNIHRRNKDRLKLY